MFEKVSQIVLEDAFGSRKVSEDGASSDLNTVNISEFYVEEVESGKTLNPDSIIVYCVVHEKALRVPFFIDLDQLTHPFEALLLYQPHLTQLTLSGRGGGPLSPPSFQDLLGLKQCL